MPVISCPDCGHDVSTLAPVCPNCGRPSPTAKIATAVAAGPVTAEETLWRGSPAWTLLIGQVIAIVLTVIVVPVAAWFLAQALVDPRVAAIGWWVTAALVLIELVRFITALVRLRSTQYTITSQRVMIERGLLTKSLSEIDLRYVDDTQFSQSVTNRLLGIGNVTLVSSDKTMPVYVLHGIRDPRAIREMIRSHAYEVSQRQLFTRAT
jgi:membrane protein YdbS with pleckstrin-like domain